MSTPVQAYLEKNFDRMLEDLKTLVRIPSVSFEGFPAKEVVRSAEAVAELLKNRGLQNVEVLRIPGKPQAHPYVYGEWLGAPGKPTLLLYAHHDVQPPGRTEKWKTQPFEPTLKEGPGGMRLYGRGTADDKAGIIVHTAAIESFLQTEGKLPCNVKVVIEGEEETGSEHLSEFLTAYRSKLDADAMVLTDAGNFDIGVPALTVALRGLAGLEVEVRALTKSVHSGMWGGPIPDPAMALTKMLSGLVDKDGRIAVPGMLDGIQPITDAEAREYASMPYDEAKFREQVGLIPQAQLLKEGPNAMVQTFRFPSLTVNAIQSSSRAQAGNIINDTAWAKVTVRVVPGMDPERVLDLLRKAITAATPWGLEVTFKTESCSPAWSTATEGSAFEAAERALERGYGHAAYKMGCGGSIPFVQPFSDALGGAPAILVGVEDPHTCAHGENESLHIGDFKKAILSQIFYFEEMGKYAAGTMKMAKGSR